MNAAPCFKRVTFTLGRAGLFALAVHSQSAFAQDDLGMRITGDDDANFGLTISNWVNGQEAGTLAPGLIGEQILPLDEWEMRMQIIVERAASAPGAPINRP